MKIPMAVAQLAKQVLAPVAKRIGTAFALVVGGYGVSGEQVDQLLSALAILGGVGFDVAVVMWNNARKG